MAAVPIARTARQRPAPRTGRGTGVGRRGADGCGGWTARPVRCSAGRSRVTASPSSTSVDWARRSAPSPSRPTAGCWSPVRGTCTSSTRTGRLVEHPRPRRRRAEPAQRLDVRSPRPVPRREHPARRTRAAGVAGVDRRGADTCARWPTGSRCRTGSASPRTARRCTTSTAGRARCSRSTTTSTPASPAGGGWCSTSDGTPDGLAVDVDGNLWIAFFGEAEVRCLTPRGEVVQVIDVPRAAPHLPGVRRAGPRRPGDHDRAAQDGREASGRHRRTSGAVFVADPGVRGLPAARWAGTTIG